ERMLSVPAAGYEFELEMLIAAKHLGFQVIEEPIRTIYEAGNPTSHFEPLRDSMRIYFVLLRFGFISMMTACLDNLIFYIFYHASGAIGGSLFGAPDRTDVQLCGSAQGGFSVPGSAPDRFAPLSAAGCRQCYAFLR